MAVKYVVAHRMDENNVGDNASNPLQYFLDTTEYEKIDVVDLYKSSVSSELPMIIGGGGLLGNNFIGDKYLRDALTNSDRNQLENCWENTWKLSNPKYRDLFREFNRSYQDLVASTLEKIDNKVGPRVLWGAGHNGEFETNFEDINWPRELSHFSLVGLRDYHESSKFDWVPCASCMHPALRKNYTIKNDVIWFEHKKQLIKDFGSVSIPRFVNSGNNIEQTIELLGSANIILTNSYHGAYWGTLLKKRVIVVHPWSSKFKWLKHQPYLLTNKKNTWDGVVDFTSIHNDALDECIDANQSFWKKVKSL
jgi:hypothetical protein